MWEQAKKKRLTLEWLYNADDVARACEENSMPETETLVDDETNEPQPKVNLTER